MCEDNRRFRCRAGNGGGEVCELSRGSWDEGAGYAVWENGRLVFGSALRETVCYCEFKAGRDIEEMVGKQKKKERWSLG